MAPFECDYGYHITVGARTFINYGAVILDGAKVTIGQDVQIGPNVQLLTALHPLDPVERGAARETAKPVTIGDGAWLATGVIVCPGVTIGARHGRRRRQRRHEGHARRSPLLRQPLPGDP